jgi:soluble lytic murein transglycosylase-like protein
MDAKEKLLTVLGVGVVGYIIYSILNQPTVSGTLDEAVSNWADCVSNTLVPGSWEANGAAYIPTINALEAQIGIPTNLLARLAYQECHWRPDIISGATRSSAGAIGMFQLLPQYFPGAGQDWQTDANTAGAYLVQQYNSFGHDWGAALAAYNDGPGNLQSILAGSKQIPTETANYVTQIIGDVPVPSAFYNQLEA